MKVLKLTVQGMGEIEVTKTEENVFIKVVDPDDSRSLLVRLDKENVAKLVDFLGGE